MPKATDFCLLLKIMSKISVKISLKTWVVNTDRKFPDNAKQSTTDASKTAKKEQFKKQQKQLVIWLVIKLLIKLLKSQEFRIGQKEMIAIC